VAKRLPGQHFQRFIIEDITAGIDQAILTMAGIRIKCHIGNYTQIGKLLL